MNIIFALLIGWFELAMLCFIRILFMHSKCIVDLGVHKNRFIGILLYVLTNPRDVFLTFGDCITKLPRIFPYIFTKEGEKSYREGVMN